MEWQRWCCWRGSRSLLAVMLEGLRPLVVAAGEGVRPPIWPHASASGARRPKRLALSASAIVSCHVFGWL